MKTCRNQSCNDNIGFSKLRGSKKVTFLWFYALNFLQTPAIIAISRTQVHTGIPHVFCHTTTAIACVFVKIWAAQNR